MPISKNEITKEMLEKAMQCNTAEDLIAYAESELNLWEHDWVIAEYQVL